MLEAFGPQSTTNVGQWAGNNYGLLRRCRPAVANFFAGDKGPTSSPPGYALLFVGPVSKLFPMLKPIVALGLDVGATRIKAVIVENDGTILDQIVLSTQQQGWTDQIADLINEVLLMCGPALEIGVCTPGLATRSGDAIWDCGGKIPGLQGLNWQKHFGWERPIPVMNDAQAALFGESWLGAATGRRNVALFTLGTGVGGAAMVDGKLLHGALGRAGHFGHISINPDPRQSVLNAPGSLEDAFGTGTPFQR